MNKLISLIKTDLNISFGVTSIIYSIKNKKNRWQMIILAIALLSLIPSYIMIVKQLDTIYDSFRAIGQRNYFLMMGFIAAVFTTFFFGLLYVMSKFYFSNDLVHLIPLPIKPSDIFTSKFISLMISEYITVLPIILPFIIIFGNKNAVRPFYYLYTILLILFIPMIPLVLASIIIMIMMKYTNISGKRDLIRTVSSIVLIIFMVLIQIKFQQGIQNALVQGENFYFNLARDANLLVRNIGKIFPPAIWGTFTLTNYKNISGLLYLLLFIIISLTSFFIMIFLAEKIFFAGLIGNNEGSTKKHRKRNKISGKDFVLKSPSVAIAQKEMIMILKTPIYLINSVGGVIMIPIIMLFSIITQDDAIDYTKKLVVEHMDLSIFVAIGFIASLAILNTVSATTFSREGDNFWIQRTLPISSVNQIIGRILASLFLQIIGAIISIISITFIVNFEFKHMILIFVLGIFASIPLIMIGMIIDIIRPMTKWTNPQQAMKQNLNVLISMGLGFLYGGVIYLMVKFMYNKIELTIIYIILIVTIMISIISFFFILKILIPKQFKSLES